MSKKIEDYLHLYLGCEVEANVLSDKSGKLISVNIGATEPYIIYKSVSGSFHDVQMKNVKPFLRPLSSMTEEEKKELYAMGSQRYKGGITQMLNLNCFDSAQFMWLLLNHFDLFGLIESGLAIDKITQQ